MTPVEILAAFRIGRVGWEEISSMFQTFEDPEVLKEAVLQSKARAHELSDELGESIERRQQD